MFQGVNPNNIVVMLVTGAFLLAAIYHTILFIHRGSRLLALYSIYLWSTFAYCLFRDIYTAYDAAVYRYLNPDEVLQMVSFVMYIRFAAYAMDLDKNKERYALLFSRITPYVIFSYLVINTILVNVEDEGPAYVIFKSIARVYLLLLGLLLIVSLLRRRRQGFYKYLGAGAVSMIICGLISFLLNLGVIGSWTFGAISWLMFGFFTDVVFFSAAIGYRIRQEHQEREKSLKALLEKDAELKEKELEKIKAVFETREQERNRIARDLHDDIGATLSSIHVYCSVATKAAMQDTKKLTEVLQQIKDNTRQVMENMGDIIWAINANSKGDLSFENKLKNYGYELLAPLNIGCVYSINKDADKALVNIEVRKNLLLIAKEAMNNIAKYSAAASAVILLKMDSQKLQLEIADDGKGFDPQTKRSGNGLDNMRLRTEALGGSFSCISEKDKGTRITCSIPVTNISYGERFGLPLNSPE